MLWIDSVPPINKVLQKTGMFLNVSHVANLQSNCNTTFNHLAVLNSKNKAPVNITE